MKIYPLIKLSVKSASLYLLSLKFDILLKIRDIKIRIFLILSPDLGSLKITNLHRESKITKTKNILNSCELVNLKSNDLENANFWLISPICYFQETLLTFFVTQICPIFALLLSIVAVIFQHLPQITISCSTSSNF